MKHLLVALFGADYAKLRQGVNVTHILAEEATDTTRNYKLGGAWWEENFPQRRGAPMGEVLAAATDDSITNSYMCDIVVAACYRVRGK